MTILSAGERQRKIDRGLQVLETAKRERRRLSEDESREVNDLLTEVNYSDLMEDRGSKPYFETRGVGSSGRTTADEAFTRYLRTGEVRTSTGLTTSPDNGQSSSENSGYMIPQGFWRNLQIALKAYGGAANDFRRVETETGNPMPWPTVDPTAVTASLIGTELTQMSPVSPYVFGQGMLSAWTVSTSPVLASLQLVEDMAFDVDSFLVDRFGESIGRELSSLAISGTGSAQPLGIVTALGAKGAWSAGQSGGFINLTAATAVKTFAASNPTELSGNLLSPQTLINMVQAVDPAYYPTCKWYFNATQAWNLRTVVDSNGRPLLNFENGLTPDNVTGDNYNLNAPVAKLFGFDVIIDNNIPNLTASTTGGPVFGSLQHAMVNRVVVPSGNATNGVRVMRLDQRWSDFLAVGYIGYYRCDFRSNDLRAAVTVKAAAT